MSDPHAIKLPTLEQASTPAGHIWAKLGIPLIVIGLVLTAGSYFAASDHHGWYFTYLTSYLYWLSIGLGAMFFTLIQHAARAGWSVVVRRFAENLMAPLWIFALLFLPIALSGGTHTLYHWTHAEAVAADPILQGKSGYLNLPFWYARAAVYFLIWAGISWYFRKKSLEQDQTGAVAITRHLQVVSNPALAAFALTISFAAIDWAMSLDPHWFSTMWGVWYFSGAILAAFAMLGFLHSWAQGSGLIKGIVTEEHFHDLGKLVFAFTIFWAYISFSQFFLIWYADIPEETTFYAGRMGNSWETLGLILMVGHFAIPFLFLMPKTVKRARLGLMAFCAYILVMHFLDLNYMIRPAYHGEGVHGFHLGLSDILAWVGIGGVFMGMVFRTMVAHPLIPLKDPRLRESMAFENY